MKHIIILLVLMISLFDSVTLAAKRTTNPLAAGLASFKEQNFKKAALQFYHIAFNRKSSAKEKSAARYYLGLSLMRLKLYQTAAFPLIVASRDTSPKIAQKAFENLVIVSDKLNDTGLLDYTLKKLDAKNLSEIAQELYLTRLGQTQMASGELDKAITSLRQSLQIRPDNDETLYTLGLTYLKKNRPLEAIAPLEKLYDKYYTRIVTDPERGKSAMALARAYYQAKKFKEATDLYRQIPKDHPLYREAQTELTWSLFRTAKFRSAMSSIQTLHTPFYENFYDPESLILRSIILVFICQNEEAEKSLNTFKKIYAPAYSSLAKLNRGNLPPEYHYKQIAAAQDYLKTLKQGKPAFYQGEAPFFLVRTAMDRGTLKNKLVYLDRIQNEKARLEKIFKNNQEQKIKSYALKILNQREKTVQKEAGGLLSESLLGKEKELSLFTGDMSLLQYEVLNGKKLAARSNYIKEVNSAAGIAQVNAADNRDFYIENGYRYWPFEGEYWRDEIGNYQYLGVNRCESQ